MSATESLVIEQVAIDLLKPDAANARNISRSELDALTRSIREFGFVQPLLVRRLDAVVIGGHQRLLAARRLGLKFVPVIWLDVSAERGQLLGLALNRTGGEWDEPLLARLLADLKDVPGVDLTLSGFGEDELADLLRGPEVQERRERPEAFDLEMALGKATREPLTKPGDMWHLGKHHLLCGDATKAEDVARVLAGAQSAMAFSDPPFNVDYGNHGGHQPGARRRPMANDALDPVAWEAFVRAWARVLLDSVDGALYVCMSSKEWPTVSRILAEECGHWSDTIIWVKDRFVLGRADYQRGYEPIWFGWREGASHFWCGDRDQSDVWQIARPAAAPLGPVMKPLELVERAIENSSRPGELVLDVFLGSGTTLIAAERTGRVCAAIELDPHYVDVAVARWETFTGCVAVKAEPVVKIGGAE
jgi:DNA modification methylase